MTQYMQSIHIIIIYVHLLYSIDDEEFHTYAAAHPFKVVPIDSPAISNYSKVSSASPPAT